VQNGTSGKKSAIRPTEQAKGKQYRNANTKITNNKVETEVYMKHGWSATKSVNEHPIHIDKLRHR
jgi:hypothetical protein